MKVKVLLTLAVPLSLVTRDKVVSKSKDLNLDLKTMASRRGSRLFTSPYFKKTFIFSVVCVLAEKTISVEDNINLKSLKENTIRHFAILLPRFNFISNSSTISHCEKKSSSEEIVEEETKQLVQTDVSEIRFIPFAKFKSLGRIPRYPDDANSTISLTDVAPETRKNSLFVFVSHGWLRGNPESIGWDGTPHPDNENGDKHKLIVQGIEKTLQVLAPDMEQCFLWLDYSCLNQDENPAQDLKTKLDKTIKYCDCIFTPLYDPQHNWEFPFDGVRNIFKDYRSKGWQGTPSSYVNRAWCRLEMFYAANLPLHENEDERTEKMRAGLKTHRELGRRTHLLYGSKEQAYNGPPRVLPALQYSYFQDNDPKKGELSKEEDREVILKLIDQVPPVPLRETTYIGGDEVNGSGKILYKNGDVYEGEWRDGKRYGRYIFRKANGDSYRGDRTGKGRWDYSDGGYCECEVKDGYRHGKGKARYVSGYTYEGQWAKNRKNPYGVYTFDDGTVFTGFRPKNKRDGTGKQIYPNGDIYEGEWKDDKRHGKGSLARKDGTVLKGNWKDDEFEV